MKKNLIILLLLLISCENLFSQNSYFNLNSGKTAQKQAIFIDLFPLMEGVWEGKAGAGLFYERRISNYFSLVEKLICIQILQMKLHILLWDMEDCIHFRPQ